MSLGSSTWHDRCLLDRIQRTLLQTVNEAAERKETTMDAKDAKNDKRISAQLIAQLIAELVAYENELATRAPRRG